MWLVHGTNPPPIAQNVRFGSCQDPTHAMQQKTLGRRVLFDHLIGACEYRRRHSRRTVRTDIRGRESTRPRKWLLGFVLKQEWDEGGVSRVECSDRSWPVTDWSSE